MDKQTLSADESPFSHGFSIVDIQGPDFGLESDNCTY